MLWNSFKLLVKKQHELYFKNVNFILMFLQQQYPSKQIPEMSDHFDVAIDHQMRPLSTGVYEYLMS